MSKSGVRSFVWTAVIVAVVLGALFGFKYWRARKAFEAMTHRGPYIVSVSAARASTMPWQGRIRAVASLTAVNGISLTTQLPGQVAGIYFHSGESVRRGERLIQINDSNQLAQLSGDLASETLDRQNYKRARSLYRLHATSRENLDAAHAAYQMASAAVANDRATLAKLAVSAPFSGRIGIRQVSLGQYLTPGVTIAALNSWDPLRVEFTVPQDQAGLIRPGQKVSIGVNGFPGRRFAGRVRALDSQIDPTTRNVAVEATLPNRKLLLRPGMFAEATVAAGVTKPVLVVPTVAVSYSSFGDYVYVVQNRKMAGRTMQVAIARPVHPGETRGAVTEILSGLKAGEQVVTAGQIKLRSGMFVSVHDEKR